MDLQLQGKKALVTGATAGIGLAIAQALALEGATVSITGRSRRTVDQALETFGAGRTVSGIVADAGSGQGAAAILAACQDPDILVNNLGIYEAKPFVETSDEDWQKQFDVNVMSGVRLTRGYFPGMLARNWGRVIFISSEAAITPAPEMVHYSMTKAALLAVSRGLAEATRGTQVTVNAVMPGPTRSPGVEEFLRKIASDPRATPAEAEREFFEKHRPGSLLGRLINADEVANLVAYVASPRSSATNGAALRVEGGLLRTIA